MKIKLCIFLVCFYAQAYAMEPVLPPGVAKMTTEQQILFVTSFIDEGFPRGHITVDGQLIERGGTAGHLMRVKSEALIPVVAARIEAEMKREKPSSKFILRLAVFICSAGTEEALHTLVRLFGDDSKLLIAEARSVLSHAFSWNEKKGFGLWYLALDSADERIREAATDICRDYLGQPFMNPEIWNGWMEALILRHGHYPGEAEMRNDPIVMAIEGRSMTHAYDIRRNIVERAAKMRSERESSPKKQ